MSDPVSQLPAPVSPVTLAGLLEQIEEAVLLIDHAGRLRHINPPAVRFLAVSAAAARGARLGAVLHLSATGRHFDPEHLLAKVGPERPHYERRLRVDLRNSDKCEVLLRLRWLGREAGVLLTLRDVRRDLQLEAELLRREAVLSHHVRHTPMGLIVFQADQTVAAWNPAAERIFGWSRAEAIGRPMADMIVPPHVREHVARLFTDLMRRGTGNSSLNENVTRDGRTIVCEWHNTCVRDADEALIGMFCMVQDVTERERQRQDLHQHRQFLESTLRSITDGVIVLDETARVLRINRAAERMIGRSLAESLERPLAEVLELRDAGTTLPMPDPLALARAHDGQDGVSLVDVPLLVSSQGEHRRVSVSAASLRHGDEPVSGTIITLRDVTEACALQQRVQADREKYHALIEATGTGFVVLDEHGRVLDANAEYLRLVGREHLDDILGCSPVEWAVPGLAERVVRGIERCLAGERTVGLRTVYTRPDGSRLAIEINAAPVQEAGRTRVYALARDRSAEQATDERLRSLSQAVDLSPSSVMILDAERRLIYANPSFERITGYKAKELLGKPTDALWLDPAGTERAEIWQTLSAGRNWSGEVRNRRADSTPIWQQVFCSPIPDEQGAPVRYLIVAEDVTDRKAQQEQLYQQAHYDALTGLPNRFLAQERLHQAVTGARRNRTHVAIFFLDLDRFKQVNDTLGHDAGDMLLKEAAYRLNAAVRADDTVARLGGDEFLIVLNGLHGGDDAVLVARKILDCFVSPYLVEDQEMVISTSIGITLYPDDAEEVGELIRNADAAMYEAKARGRNTYYRFTAEMNERAMRRMRMEGVLRHALERGEIYAAYQPLIDLATGRPYGVEALMRWQSTEFGAVSPVEFIPIAEESGLINELGSWIIGQACRDAQRWAAQGWALGVSVNVSAPQLFQPDFVEQALAAVTGAGLQADQVTLEVTESVLLEAGPEVEGVLQRLHETGFRLAMDDFGTGYSSLAYLKRFPFDIIKIDRTFVRDIAEDRSDLALTRAIIAMAHSLDLRVTAEGVEDRAQLELLLEHGCDSAQGFYYGRPVPVGALTDWLRQQRPAGGALERGAR